MKKSIKVLCMLLVLMSAAIASADAVYDIPEFAPTDANPKVDAAGNTWGLYSYNEHPEAWNSTVTAGNFSNYVPMTWWSYASRWDGLGHKVSYIGNTLTAGCDVSYDYAAALAFTAGAAGTYSIQGSATLIDVTATWNYANMKIGKFDTLGNFTLLHNQSVSNAGIIDLTALPALQNMTLDAGDKLVFSAHAQEGAYRFTTLDLTDTTISYVPEPTTLGLISVGALGLIRRKK